MTNQGMMETIQERNVKLATYFAENDRNGLMKDLYTEDCEITTPDVVDSNVYRHRDIRELVTDMRARGVTSYERHTDKVGKLGTGCKLQEEGHYIITRADGSKTSGRSYRVIWEHTGDCYKLYRDTFHSRQE